jgi:hypothetical protein
MLRRNRRQHGSEFRDTANSRPILRQGKEPQWLVLYKNMLVSKEVYGFARGTEVFPGEEEPDPNDYPNAEELEDAQDDYAKLVEEKNKAVIYSISWTVESLARSPGYLDKAQRIIDAEPAWTIRQVYQFVHTGFVARTPRQIEKARRDFEETHQGPKEKVSVYFIRMNDNKNIYESLADEAVTAYEFLRRLLENTNTTMRQYSLILLQDIKRIKAHNDNEPDEDEHQDYTEPHIIIQELEAFESDIKSDMKDNGKNESNSHNKNHKKRQNGKQEKTEQVFTVTKADFDRLNTWKANKSKPANNNTKNNTANNHKKNTGGEATKSRGICYNFQNTGSCSRQDCPYQHVPRKASNNQQMVPYRGGSSNRGGRGHGGRANAARSFEYEDTRPYEEIMRDHDEQGSAYYYNNYENSNTHFQRPRYPPPASDFSDGSQSGTRHVRGMRSESSRRGLSILMVTNDAGNNLFDKPFSNSVPNKYYTPISHNIIFRDFCCTTNPRHAMYMIHYGDLIIPYHYFVHMFTLLKHYELYAPEYLTYHNSRLIIHCKNPISRCEFSHGPVTPRSKHIDYRPRRSLGRFDFA